MVDRWVVELVFLTVVTTAVCSAEKSADCLVALMALQSVAERAV